MTNQTTTTGQRPGFTYDAQSYRPVPANLAPICARRFTEAIGFIGAPSAPGAGVMDVMMFYAGQTGQAKAIIGGLLDIIGQLAYDLEHKTTDD